MKKILLFVLMYVCVSIGAWASVTITADGDDGVIIVCDDFGDLTSWNQQNPKLEADLAILERLNSAGKLTLRGKYNSNDLSVFQNQWNKSTTVDFWDAEFDTFEKATGGYTDPETNQWVVTTTTFSCQTFKYWLDATTIVMSDKETNTFDRESMFQSFNSNKPPLQNVTFAGAIDVPNELFKSCSLKSVTFSSKVTGIGQSAFQDCQNLEKVDFGNNCHITVIGKNAFTRAGKDVKDENNNVVPFPKDNKGELVIPNSVTEIKEEAFLECPIKTLVINKGSQLESIESRAFWYEDGPLSEVYVNKTDAVINCHELAFDYKHTDSHTDVATVKTRLYYPAEFFDHYVGNWKESAMGGVINQFNVQTMENIIKQGGTGVDGVYYPATHNGWHMFVSSGIGFTHKTRWRTYSTVVTFKVPDTDYVKTYLVCGYNKNGQVELVQMNEDEPIPANTGVLFHYVHQENADFSAVVPIVQTTTDKQRYDDQLFPNNKYVKNNKEYANYLRKLNREAPLISNVCKEDGVTYRNFFLSEGVQLDAAEQYKGDDYVPGTVSGWGFFRAVSKQYPTINNKAYLHLPGTLCPSDANYGTVDDSNATNAKSFGMIIIDGEIEEESGIATAIHHAASELSDDDNVYYTLQGIRVSNPAKGVYIHNGKKIIVR